MSNGRQQCEGLSGALGGGGLRAAHRGYVYQDVATAYLLAWAHYHGGQRVTVDRKEYEGDLFDDLTLEHAGRKVRRQFKSSADSQKRLAQAHLKTRTRNLRIDDLLECFRRAGEQPADEYRICSTWKSPDDPELARLLARCDVPGSFPGWPTRRHRLRAGIIWPDRGEPIWKPLRDDAGDRRDFVEFARKLVIELECPQISLDMNAPGPLENLLLEFLSERIGIGRYPNQEHRLEEAASHLVLRARQARTRGESVNPSDLRQWLHLRTDFGRVAQRFPVVEARRVTRDEDEAGLRERILTESLLLLTGAPGSGKSWLVTQLAKDLRESGHLVARHYCYLEPGDASRSERIKSNTLFGNLMAEVCDAEPALRVSQTARYAAGPRELAELLGKAVDQDAARRVVLIVDGLDHISRVLAETGSVSREEANIAGELAGLAVPPGVCVLVVSQPGPHLRPLSGRAASADLVGWERKHTCDLAEKLGVLAKLRSLGQDAGLEEFVDTLHERCEGNPLYATFLCKETKQALDAGHVADPLDVLCQAPQLQGDLGNYYRYLLGPSGQNAVANVLAHLDFAVTEAELGEMHPVLKADIPATVLRLSPVLVRVSSQGGLRIYHESFRRFIVAQLREKGTQPCEVLGPAIRWLEERGLFEDQRAYRFLLRCLRRSGRDQAVIDRVQADFVSQSLAAGHPEKAIRTNLAVALEAAAALQDWPALTRLAELSRSVQTCFQENLLDFTSYGHTFRSIHGTERLAERLLFDGRPTRGRDEGVVLCSLCDDACTPAPWREYWELPRDRTLDEGREKAILADFHGKIRLSGIGATCTALAEWLDANPEPPLWYLRGVLRRLAKEGGSRAVDQVIENVGVPGNTLAELEAALARSYAEEGKSQEASDAATAAVGHSSDPELARECMEFGAEKGVLLDFCTRLSTLTKQIAHVSYIGAEVPVEEWVACVHIAARVDEDSVVPVAESLTQEGWYHAWLRFVTDLARAEAKARSEGTAAEAEVVSALECLAREQDPFEGDPRACDLYSIWDVIHRTFAQALLRLRSRDGWDRATALLGSISRHTTTYLDGSPGGPLVATALVDILLPHTIPNAAAPGILEAIRRQVERARSEFHSVQADLDMRLARACSAVGENEAARGSWHRACQHLAAYGFHKDTTIFQLIQGLYPLIALDEVRATELLASLQPMIHDMDVRTDGKETDHALIEWHGALGAASPAAAALLLARSLALHGGVMSWRLEKCLRRLLSRVAAAADPFLVLHLYQTVPFDGTEPDVRGRLKVVTRLLAEDEEVGRLTFGRVVAQVQGDSKECSDEAAETIQRFAEEHDLPVGAEWLLPAPGSEQAADIEQQRAISGPELSERLAANPLLPEGATVLEISARLREIRALPGDRRRQNEWLVNALGYRLCELLEKGNDSDARSLLLHITRTAYPSDTDELLVRIAVGLERLGHAEQAALACALCYANTSIRGWWLSQDEQDPPTWVGRGLLLSKAMFLQTLADEMVELVSAEPYGMGLVCRTISICTLDHQSETAFKCWEQAFAVIGHRLPGYGDAKSEFISYEQSIGEGWSLNEALAFLLLTRVSHPEYHRKYAALAGCAEVLVRKPQLVVRPIRELLQRDTPLTSCLLVLRTIQEAEGPPYAVSTHLVEELRLLQQCDLLALRMAADFLVERIGPSC